MKLHGIFFCLHFPFLKNNVLVSGRHAGKMIEKSFHYSQSQGDGNWEKQEIKRMDKMLVLIWKMGT